MRDNSTPFGNMLGQHQKNLRLVIHIDIDAGIWLTSHSDIDLGSVSGVTVNSCIEGVSSTSQKLNASAGRAEIGSINFEVTDIGASFSIALRDALVNGYGLNGKTVTLYRGFEGLAFADYRLEQTQQVHKTVSYKDGSYKVQCADIQRQMRKDVFDPAKTILTANATKTATTIQVASTAGFEPCKHLPCFKEADGAGTFYYFKIKYKNGFEIIRATGKTNTTFTGCTRARFGTKAQAHTIPADTGSDQGIEVEEYIYIEMPAPMLAHAVLTGKYYDASATEYTLPASWHLGIGTAYVNYSEFSDIGSDWYEPTNPDSGVVLRFDGMAKQDGKTFVEKQICLLLGAFMPIRADGRIGFARMAPVLRTSTAVAQLDGDTIVSYSDLRQSLDGMHNVLDISWARVHVSGEDKPRYLRRNIFKDQISVSVNGEGQPLKLIFDGLHNARHTKTTLFGRFDALRDRYTHPPFSLDLTLLPSAASLEVGDVVRVKLNILRDYTTGAGLDRAFEVQQVTVDQVSGKVIAKLFGASFRSEPIEDNPTSGQAGDPVLLDSWYSSEGTDLSTVLSISSGVLQANGSLASGIYYLTGDFTVPAGLKLTISGSVQLRIMGHLQVDGEIGGRGNGNAAGVAGVIGTAAGGYGIYAGTVRYSAGAEKVYQIVRYYEGEKIVGKYQTLPNFGLDNPDGNLKGLPPSLVGSGGGKGGDADYLGTGQSVIPGGIGGPGGPGLVTVSRGMAFGLSGLVDVSGGAGTLGQSDISESPGAFGWVSGWVIQGGTGAGGAPGGLFSVIDGNSSTAPIFIGKVQNENGASPSTPENDRAGGLNVGSLGDAGYRWVYAPQPRVPIEEPDAEGITWADIVDDGTKPADNANFTDNTNQLTDGAGLGQTALLSGVSGLESLDTTGGDFVWAGNLIQAASFTEGGATLSTKYAPYSHMHDASDINAGVLDPARLPDLSGTYLPTAGTAAAASKLETARAISLTGDVTGSASFDGSANVSIAATVTSGGGTDFTWWKYPARGAVSDLNAVVTGGLYGLDNTQTNAPAISSVWGNMLTVSGNSDVVWQMYGDHLANLFLRGGNPPESGGAGSWGAWNKVYHSGNDGSGSGLDADMLRGFIPSSGADANTAALRNGSADIYARLFRSTYSNEGGIAGSAALAFRNNTTDNYIRFCSSPAAVRGWLGAGTGNANAASKGANGYWKCGDTGVIIQWMWQGTWTVKDTNYSASWPIAFPNACRMVQFTGVTVSSFTTTYAPHSWDYPSNQRTTCKYRTSNTATRHGIMCLGIGY